MISIEIKIDEILRFGKKLFFYLISHIYLIVIILLILITVLSVLFLYLFNDYPLKYIFLSSTIYFIISIFSLIVSLLFITFRYISIKKDYQRKIELLGSTENEINKRYDTKRKKFFSLSLAIIALCIGSIAVKIHNSNRNFSPSISDRDSITKKNHIILIANFHHDKQGKISDEIFNDLRSTIENGSIYNISLKKAMITFDDSKEKISEEIQKYLTETKCSAIIWGSYISEHKFHPYITFSQELFKLKPTDTPDDELKELKLSYFRTQRPKLEFYGRWITSYTSWVNLVTTDRSYKIGSPTGIITEDDILNVAMPSEFLDDSLFYINMINGYTYYLIDDMAKSSFFFSKAIKLSPNDWKWKTICFFYTGTSLLKNGMRNDDIIESCSSIIHGSNNLILGLQLIDQYKSILGTEYQILAAQFHHNIAASYLELSPVVPEFKNAIKQSLLHSKSAKKLIDQQKYPIEYARSCLLTMKAIMAQTQIRKTNSKEDFSDFKRSLQEAIEAMNILMPMANNENRISRITGVYKNMEL